MLDQRLRRLERDLDVSDPIAVEALANELTRAGLGWTKQKLPKGLRCSIFGKYSMQFESETLGFHYLPPGKFMMGSPENIPGRDDDETLHEVTLTKGFFLSDLITQNIYQSITGKTCGKDHPSKPYATRANWFDAKAFCDSLGFTLPTEAQWEYACKANLGPKDMLGNVCQWCQDYYQVDVTNETIDPVITKGNTRVVRGGSWFLDSGYCRAAYRDGLAPASRFDSLGFRVSVVAEDV